MLCSLLLLAATTSSPRFVALEENLRKADIIVYGHIEKILQTRSSNADAPGWSSGGRYLFRVERAFRGAPRGKEVLRIAGCGDWTCEARQMEYQPDQRMLLFLERRGAALSPYAGFQSERIEIDGRLSQPHLPYGRTWPSARFLDGLPDLLKFVELTPRSSTDVTAWQALLVHPNPTLRRFGLLRIDQYDLYGASEEGDVRWFQDLPRPARTSLMAGVLANLGHEESELRNAARAGAGELWQSLGDGVLELPEGRSFAEAAIERLHEVAGRGVEGEALPCLRLRAELGDRSAVAPLLESLAPERHATGHRGCSKTLRALSAMHRVVSLRNRAVLDTVAAHGDDDACAYDLGRLAVALVNGDGGPARLDVAEVPRRQWAVRFRAWWPAHRESFPADDR